MSSNVQLNPGALGAVLTTDQDINGVQTQIVKLSFAAAGQTGVSQLVTLANPLPVQFSGGVTVNGSVSVSNFPATQPVSIAATVNANITNASLAITGNVGITGTVATKPDNSVWTLTGTSANVNVTNASLAVTQSGAWTVGVNNFPATQVVSQATGTNLHTVVDSGTVTVSGTVPVTGAVTVSNLPLSGSGNLLVDATLAGVDVGPALMESALPVTLAVDQQVPIQPTGQTPSANALSVVLASDQVAIPVNATVVSATQLPPGAALEAGNLASISASDAYTTQTADILRLVLAELRTMNMQLAVMTGINIDPNIGDEQAIYQ